MNFFNCFSFGNFQPLNSKIKPMNNLGDQDDLQKKS